MKKPIFYDSCCYKTEYDGETHIYFPTVRWFTYADMYIYCLEHPEVVDYEAEATSLEPEESKIMKPNPIFALKDRVDAFLEIEGYDGWNEELSQIRIVYWIE